MKIERKRYIVMRNNRTEIWCGNARAYHFRSINDITNVNIVSYHSEKKVLASCSSYDRDFEVVEITETLETEEKSQKVNCKHCGKVLDNIDINMFNYDGSDSFYKEEFFASDDQIIIQTNKNWTGYDLTEKEMKDTIECPHCHHYPFDKSKSIEIQDVVIVTC